MNETLLNKARLNVVSLNKALINGAVERHGSSAGGGGAPSKYIRFADPAVEAVLMANGVSSDGVGITKEDAAAVTSIGTWLKGNTDITSFDEFKYFTGITLLNDYSFQECTSLKSIIIPSSVTQINTESFYNCTSLTNCVIPMSVVSLQNNVFRNCPMTNDINLPNLTSLGTRVFQNTAIRRVVSLGKIPSIPDGDNSSGTFYGCKSLSDVNLHEGLTYIGRSAFAQCTSLALIDIPSSVTVIGWNSFIGSAISSVNAPGATEIRQGAFTNCANLRTISAPIVTTIGQNAFMGCSSLEQLLLPLCETIGDVTFRNCTSLTLLEIGANIKSIGTYQFGDYTAVMPPNLWAIVVRATTPPTLGSSGWYGTTCPIYVPDASVEAYKTATNWVSFADRIHPLSEIEGSLVFYDKLVGDGTAYINTEYYPKGLDSFAWDAEPPTSWNKFLFGCKNTKLNLGLLVYRTDQTYYLVGSTTTKLIYEDNTTRITRQMAVVSVDGAYKRNLVEDGNATTELGSVGSYASAVSTTPLLVFACQKSATDTSAERIYNGAIRSFSITDIDGNTIMSLKPCTFAGETGMWDEVNGKFYGNAATSGEFSVAND